jgi:hypothetical protein
VYRAIVRKPRTAKDVTMSQDSVGVNREFQVDLVTVAAVATGIILRKGVFRADAKPNTHLVSVVMPKPDSASVFREW